MDRGKAQRILEKALELAKSRGALAADCLWCRYDSRSFSARDDELERSRSSTAVSLGLRVLDGQSRQGVASLNDPDEDAAQLLCDGAFQNASFGEVESDVLFAERQPDPPAMDLGICDQKLIAWAPGAQIDLCLEMSRQARKLDKRVKAVRAAAVDTAWGESLMMNSLGVCCENHFTTGGIGMAVLAEDGDAVEIGGAGVDGRSLESLTSWLPTEEAVEHATRLLHGQPLKTGRYRLVLEPEVTALLLGALADLFSASNVCRGFSLLADKMGQKVASETLTLVDDGRLYGGLGTSPCDSECVATGRTTVLRGGCLTSWLSNLQYGKKLGMASTGNGVRGMSSLPDVDVSNFFVMPGTRPWEDIVADNDGCFCVTELMGLHTVDTATGEYSLAARGLMYRQGAFSPVSSVTIAGNLLDFLAKVGEIGGDLRFYDRIGGCTMVVDDIAVSGS